MRLRFNMLPGGMREGGWRIENWLRETLGDHDHAVHSSTLTFAVYLRTVADAQRFVDAFPELRLADGIASEYGIKVPKVPHQGWSCLARGPKSENDR